MASPSPSGERSPSLAYASSVEFILGHTPSPKDTSAATDHYMELLSHVGRHLVDIVAARRSLEKDQTSLSEIAVVLHRMEFYTGSVCALQAR
ncbi:hypothetical protein LIER_24314 [Lithospermum erythrorhizon]|uniref:Uncharacterized protein n=1 Tax=Lithospermum erythrorhizon TaxID=34254 RepID=A0AAV3R4P2_LITER